MYLKESNDVDGMNFQQIVVYATKFRCLSRVREESHLFSDINVPLADPSISPGIPTQLGCHELICPQHAELCEYHFHPISLVAT